MHRGAVWASGAAQAAQFVRIILRWRGAFGVCGGVVEFWLRLSQNRFGYSSARGARGRFEATWLVGFLFINKG